MTNQFVWIDIPVRELDRAIAFYTAVLGAPVKKDSFEGLSFGIFPHSDTSVSGCLYVPKPGDNQPSQTGPLLYLNVSDRLDQALAAVAQHGGKVIQPNTRSVRIGFARSLSIPKVIGLSRNIPPTRLGPAAAGRRRVNSALGTHNPGSPR